MVCCWEDKFIRRMAEKGGPLAGALSAIIFLPVLPMAVRRLCPERGNASQRDPVHPLGSCQFLTSAESSCPRPRRASGSSQSRRPLPPPSGGSARWRTIKTVGSSAIARLVKAGVDLPTIQKISGHKTLAMVLRYVHLHGEHIDVAIEALNTDFLDTMTRELHTPLMMSCPEVPNCHD